MATTPQPQKRAVSNYLVPADGGTHCMAFTQDFSNPLNIDWSQYNQDGLEFNPSGFIVNNQSGANMLIKVNEINHTIIIPNGMYVSMQYPAPVGHTLTITGAGNATIVFVDYPVLPFQLVA